MPKPISDPLEEMQNQLRLILNTQKENKQRHEQMNQLDQTIKAM